MPWMIIVAAAAMAVGGAIAGASDKKTSSTQTATLPAQTPAQTAALAQQQAAYNKLNSFAAPTYKPPDLSSFNNLMASLIESGGLPNAKQTDQANTFAKNIFAPQQESLNQSFVDQRYAANNQAAVMGRSGDDPILLAKLAQSQTNAQRLMMADQGSLAAKIGLQIPQNQYQFSMGQTGVLMQQNAQQNQFALNAAQLTAQNNAAVFGAASTVANQQNQMQAIQATTTGTNTQHGSFAQGLAGSFQGFGQGMGMGNAMNNMGSAGQFGGGGGSGYTMPPISSYYNQPNPYSSAGWSY